MNLRRSRRRVERLRATQVSWEKKKLVYGLFQVAHDPRCAKSGVYWSWNGGPREGRGAEALEKGGQITGGGGAGGGWDSIYENDQSDKVLNQDTASDLFKYSTIVTGARSGRRPISPSPRARRSR